MYSDTNPAGLCFTLFPGAGKGLSCMRRGGSFTITLWIAGAKTGSKAARIICAAAGGRPAAPVPAGGPERRKKEHER
jgi:hypothetical protein